MARSLLGLLWVALLMPRLPDAIPAKELRTHADTAWLVGTAAQALPYHSILSAGANSFPSGSDATDPDHAGDRARLAMAAWALEVPFDSADVKAPPPVCPSDRAAPRLNGYRLEHVRITKSDSVQHEGRKGWFHYVVSFTRVCGMEGKPHALTSDVDFDAVPDTGSAYVWRVGWRRYDPDPVPLTPARPYNPSFRDRHGELADIALASILLGPLLFPVLASMVGAAGGRPAIAKLLGGWSIVGIILGVVSYLPAFAASFFVFVIPGVTYVSVVGPREGSSRLRFGRASALCLLMYVACFWIWVIMLLNNVG